MDEQPLSRKRQIIATLSVLIVIVVIVGVVTVTSKKNDASDASTATTSQSGTSDTPANQTATNSTTSSGSSTTTSSTTANASGYADGTYSAEGEYESPGGNETLTVKVTLEDGVITDTSAVASADNSESKEYQDQFISGYKSQVVGKAIASVSLSRVSGSSLTSQGFNDAIDQIKSDASTS